MAGTVVLFALAIAVAFALNKNHKPRITKRTRFMVVEPIAVASPVEPPPDRVSQAFEASLLPRKRTTPYRDRFRLLNNTEIALYQRLVEAAPAMIVFAQVSMSQLFHIRGAESYAKLNEIGKKSLDFVICRPDTSIVAALEFNGPSHDNEHRRRSDDKKKEALEQAGIPLLVLSTTPLPSVTELRGLLAPMLIERRQHEHERDVRLRRKARS